MFSRFQALVFILTLIITGVSFSYAKQDDDSTTRAETMLEQIENLVLIDIDESIRLLNEAENSQVIQQSDYLQSYLTNLKGYVALYQSEYGLATQYFQQARMLASKANNIPQQAYSYRREGIMMMVLGQYSEAINLFEKSLNLALNSNDNVDTSPIYLQITNTYKLLEQNDNVLRYAKPLLAQARLEDSHLGIASSYYFQSSVYIERGDFDTAIKLLDSLSQFTNSLPDIQYLSSFAPLGYAKLAIARGKLEVARKNVDSSINIVQSLNYTAGLIEPYLTKSEILFLNGEIEEAIKQLELVLKLSDEINLLNYKLTALLKLSEIFEQKGEYQLALSYLHSHIREKQVFQLQKERELLIVQQARMNLSDKEKQIQELTFQQELNEQERQNQVTLMIVFAFIVVVLTIFVVILQRQKKQLKLTSIELKRAANTKSEFLARMSHEIRTPINAIIGLTKLSLNNSENSRQTTNLQQIEESSNTLLSVINDILDFSKIDAGKLRIENEPFDLDEVINQCIRLHKLKAIEKGLELILFIHRDVPLTLRGDSLRLQQILNNLLSNALKFTAKGSVSLIVKRIFTTNNLFIEFEVKDTGVGMNLLKFDNLFDSFSQADESTTRLYGGSGLGLTICKQLVELMGGKIWVESLPNKGATFFFRVPFKESEIKTTATRFKTDLSSLRVLIVDELEFSRNSISDTLYRFGINPDISDNGHKAITKFRTAIDANFPYDLILLNNMLADINGIEVAAIMKQEKLSYNPKIIMLTSGELTALKRAGKSTGIDGYLNKPISVSSMFQAINQAILGRSSNTFTSNRDIPSIKLDNIRILLVEDNQLNQKVALGFLKDSSAEVVVANNGKVALETLNREANFDLILMDIEMPVMDGLTATTKIREELKSTIPIIAMTAHAMADEVSKFISVGMDSHISKPVDPFILFKTIKTVLFEESTIVENDENINLQHSDLNSEAVDELIFIDKEKALKAMMGSQELYLEMVDEFISLSPQINKLKKATDSKDLKTMLRVIHSIKPSLHYIGAYALADYIVALEKDLKLASEPIPDQLTMRVIIAILAITKIAKTIKQ